MFVSGAVSASIGGLLMVLFLCWQSQSWMLTVGIVLWIIGMVILTIYYKRKK